MKLFPSIIASLTLMSAHLAGAMATEEKTFLQCKPDQSEKMGGSFDLMIDRGSKKIEFLTIREKLNLEESETEIFSRLATDKTLAFEFAINKFTLRFREFNLAGPAFGLGNGHSAGQCSIQQKKI